MRERFVERLGMLQEQEARLGGMLRELAAEMEGVRSQLDATMGARQECEYWLGEFSVAEDAENGAVREPPVLEELGELADMMLAEAAEVLSPVNDED